jgi:hypothetical protein
MNWREYVMARRLLDEERLGQYQRREDYEELAREQAGQDALRARGLVG